MPTQLDRPPTASTPPRRRRRFLSEDQDVRSFQAGLLLTIVLWPLIIWIFGLALKHLGHASSSIASAPPKPTFSIELNPEQPLFVPQKPPPPNRFVETNPDAPENTPDKTRNFSSRNTQAAQEKPTPDGKSDTPALEGKKEDRENTQVVDGHLHDQEKEQPSPPPMPEIPQSATPPEPVRKEQIPLPGAEKVEGENTEGFGANVAKTKEGAAPVPEEIKGAKDGQATVGAPQLSTPKIDPQRPQPRKRIDRNVRPAILVDNKFGTSNIGPVAFDARWSAYGQYLQQLIETVQVQWERILDQTKVYPPSGTTVTVKFRLDSNGAVAEILSSESTGGTQAERACQSAITARAPYGKWTDDMIATLGESQDLTFTFYYY